MNKCLYCYGELPEGVRDFHPKCSKKIFEAANAPILPYRREDLDSLALEVIARSTAITGVQEKLSLDIHKNSKHDAGRFTIVGLWGRYILKPQTELYSNLPELEDLAMHLAEEAGIKTVPHSLIRFEDRELCYITRRIDRRADGSKIPMEDMCQLTNRMTEQKYNGSYEQIAKAISKFSSAPKIDLVNFYEAVVFSWLIGNADMHLKNFSLFQPFIGRVMLAPAYDLVPTKLAIPTDNEELALTLNGKKRKIRREDFEAAMEGAGLPHKSIQYILDKFHRHLPRWNEWIERSFLPEDMKIEFKSLFSERLNRIARAQ